MGNLSEAIRKIRIILRRTGLNSKTITALARYGRIIRKSCFLFKLEKFNFQIKKTNSKFFYSVFFLFIKFIHFLYLIVVNCFFVFSVFSNRLVYFLLMCFFLVLSVVYAKIVNIRCILLSFSI